MKNRSHLKKEKRTIQTKRGTVTRSVWVKAYRVTTGRKVAVRKTQRLAIDAGGNIASAIVRTPIVATGQAIGGFLGENVGRSLGVVAPAPLMSFIGARVGRTVGSGIGGAIASIPARFVGQRAYNHVASNLDRRTR